MAFHAKFYLKINLGTLVGRVFWHNIEYAKL